MNRLNIITGQVTAHSTLSLSETPVDRQFKDLSIRRGPQGAGVIILDRKASLNALNLDMVEGVLATLRAWAKDPAIHFVVIRGAGSKAFCAGGDIIGLVKPPYPGFAARFFRTEYEMNLTISTYSKPILSAIHGFVMGGGVGISVHGTYRLVTDNTNFAMPETGIGLIPDVGGSYILSRCPGVMGMFCGLTGQRLKAGDLLACGIATHYVKQNDFTALVDKLVAGDVSHLKNALTALETGPSPRIMKTGSPSRTVIDVCFREMSVMDIITKLTSYSVLDGTVPATLSQAAFATSILQTLKKHSPTSLELAFLTITRARNLTLKEALQMEFRVCVRLAEEGRDFAEGVRAQVIDKDRKPKWHKCATSQTLREYVQPLSGHAELFS